MLLVSLVVLLLPIHASILLARHSRQMDDLATFGSDTWEYQSLAVNLLHGHGHQFGGIEPFETYRFRPPIAQELQTFFMGEPGYSFFRTPGYPAFLALVYRAGGIHPRYAKLAQLSLLAVMAACMPVLGFVYWGRDGVITSTVASFLFVRFFAPDPSEILTEPLIAFSLFLEALALQLWEARPQRLGSTALLGTASGLLLLVKGLSIFIPPLVLAYMVYRKAPPRTALLFCASMLAVLVPWSLYASLRSRGLVLLSTQGPVILVDCNNARSIETGYWEPDWKPEPEGWRYVLFPRPPGSTAAAARRFATFLVTHKAALPRMYRNKISYATRHRGVVLCFVLALVYFWDVLLLKVCLAAHVGAVRGAPAFVVMCVVNVVLVTLLFYGEHRLLLPFLYFVTLAATYLPVHLYRSKQALVGLGCGGPERGA